MTVISIAAAGIFLIVMAWALCSVAARADRMRLAALDRAGIRPLPGAKARGAKARGAAKAPPPARAA